MRKAMQAEPENYVGQLAAGHYWTWGTRSRGTTKLVCATLFDPVYFINLLKTIILLLLHLTVNMKQYSNYLTYF